MDYLIKNLKFIPMKIELTNRLVQQDLYILLNMPPDNILFHEEEGEFFLQRKEDEDMSTFYRYENVCDVVKDIESIKKLIEDIDN